MQLQPVRWLFAMALAEDFKVISACMREFAAALLEGLGQTKLNEDANRVMAMQAAKGASKRCNPLRKWLGPVR